MPSFTLKASTAVFLSTVALSAQATDFRSLAMGGTGVTAGKSAAGVSINPALLMREKRENSGEAMYFGLGLGLQDSGAIASKADEFEDLPDELQDAADVLDQENLTCDPSSDPDTEVCLTDTQALGDAAAKLLTLLNDADDAPVNMQSEINVGGMWTAQTLPFAVHLGVKTTFSGAVDVGQSELDYVDSLATSMGDNELTLGEINNYASISIETTGGTATIKIDEVDQEVDSEAKIYAVARASIGASVAQTYTLGGHDIDVGFTPKLSSVLATNAVESDDSTVDTEDALEANEVQEISLTADVGAAYAVPQKPGLTVGGLIKNLIPQTITTNDGFEIETTPQLVASVLYETEQFTATADASLNEAKYDNVPSQVIAAGAEKTFGIVDLRAGLQADLAINKPVSLTLGLGVGILDLALQVSDSNVGFGIQLAN